MLLIFLIGLAFSVLLIYLTHAPFLLQEWLGVSNGVFSAIFAGNVVAMASVALLNRRLLHNLEPRQILRVALPCQGVAVLLLLAVTLLPVPRWLLVPALMMVIGCMGAIAPNVQAGVMQYFKALGGTAAALMGAMQFAIGGALSAVSAVLVEGHASRVAAAMLVCSVLANLLAIPAVRRLGEPVAVVL
jgi:DHA1 family bicyclomycin/chloramphenicol resistance-like MFS transporter